MHRAFILRLVYPWIVVFVFLKGNFPGKKEILRQDEGEKTPKSQSYFVRIKREPRIRSLVSRRGESPTGLGTDFCRRGGNDGCERRGFRTYRTSSPAAGCGVLAARCGQRPREQFTVNTEEKKSRPEASKTRIAKKSKSKRKRIEKR
jgi:hypothetical protein